MSVPRIVDAHMHLGAPFTLFTHGWELRDVLSRMNRLHIDRAYSIHHAWLAGRYEEARAASIQVAEATSGRFPFLGVFDPRREKQSLAAMFGEVVVPATTNPLGVKGAGEAGTTAALAAVMNAIADAVRSAARMDMPATPEKVWAACRKASGH